MKIDLIPGETFTIDLGEGVRLDLRKQTLARGIEVVGYSSKHCKVFREYIPANLSCSAQIA